MQIGIWLGQNERMWRFVPWEALFQGRHFDQESVVLKVRWYLTYKLSYRDLVARMGQRGMDLAPHHPALGATLHPGIPPTLATLCANGRRLREDGRNLGTHKRPVDLLISGSG